MKKQNSMKKEDKFQDEVLLFIKFGKKEHLEKLLKSGEVYMNHTSYFLSIENEEVGDSYEGISHLMQASKIFFSDILEKPEWLSLFDGQGKQSVDLRYSSTKNSGNLFCMYACNKGILEKEYKGNLYHILPTEVTNGFGNAICIIHRPNEFIKRIQNALKDKGFLSKHEMVRYYDEKSYDGEITPFMKREIYSHQNEYRIFCENKCDEPILLSLGSLEDIAIIKEEGVIKIILENGKKAFFVIYREKKEIETILTNATLI